ncbi:MAG TPA: hypothetical protein VN622_14565 [Clostridia bacterium]|nr:hypothetical protein [Clostridia bacterium]
MKRSLLIVSLVFVISLSALAAPLGTNARAVIPSQVQQIISVDYRAMRNSETAMALKARVLPENLKEFETTLRTMGIADNDVEQLTFASFRSRQSVRAVGIAQGQFPTKKIVLRMKQRKIRPQKYRQALIYPTGTGMVMSFLDENTLLFGESVAVHEAIDSRDGEAEGLNSNSQLTDLIAAVESGPVWSILDQRGTQNMLRSILGDASRLADYDTVKKRLIGSRYTMDFSRGVNFDLDVITSDSMTAATLSSLLKAGVLYKKMNASAVEKMALDSMSVDSDSARLQIHFKSDDKKFQSLLSSDLFAAVSR